MNNINYDFSKLQPRFKKFNFEKLNDKQKEMFNEIYYTYNKLLYTYFSRYSSILKIEEKMDNSDLFFVKLDDLKKDFYQKNSNDIFKYIYVRSNLHVYRLSNEEINFLISKYNNQNYDIDNNTINFLKNTINRVVTEIDNNHSTFDINYGPSIYKNVYAQNDNLVIGIRYEYINNGLDDKEWVTNYEKQMDYIDNTINDIKSDIERLFNINVTVILYDEKTVII